MALRRRTWRKAVVTVGYRGAGDAHLVSDGGAGRDRLRLATRSTHASSTTRGCGLPSIDFRRARSLLAESFSSSRFSGGRSSGRDGTAVTGTLSPRSTARRSGRSLGDGASGVHRHHLAQPAADAGGSVQRVPAAPTPPAHDAAPATRQRSLRPPGHLLDRLRPHPDLHGHHPRLHGRDHRRRPALHLAHRRPCAADPHQHRPGPRPTPTRRSPTSTGPATTRPPSPSPGAPPSPSTAAHPTPSPAPPRPTARRSASTSSRRTPSSPTRTTDSAGDRLHRVGEQSLPLRRGCTSCASTRPAVTAFPLEPVAAFWNAVNESATVAPFAAATPPMTAVQQTRGRRRERVVVQRVVVHDHDPAARSARRSEAWRGSSRGSPAPCCRRPGTPPGSGSDRRSSTGRGTRRSRRSAR